MRPPSGRYVPTGHLVYARTGGLLATPFDLGRLQVTGRQVPILEGVLTSGTGNARFSISDTGLLSYVAGGSATVSRAIVWVNRKGTATPITRVPAFSYTARVSPDGRRITVSVGEQGNIDVWIYEVGRDVLTRLTFDAAPDNFPVWTPDGKRVATLPANRRREPLVEGRRRQCRRGTPHRLAQPPSGTGFSPDGKWLAYQEVSSSGAMDIMILPMTGERKPQAFLQTPFWEGEAQFSPDARWLAYVSNETGRYEVYVQPYPGAGRQEADFGRRRPGTGLGP